MTARALAAAGLIAVSAVLPTTARSSPPSPLGSLPSAGTTIQPCSDGSSFAAFVQETTPDVNGYVVPHSGVITEWTGATAVGGAAGRLQLLVLRGTGTTRQVVTASRVVDVSGVAGGQSVGTLARIPVAAGDVVAIAGAGPNAACHFESGLGAADAIREAVFKPAIPFQRLQVLPFGEPTSGAGSQGLRAAVHAQLESDADGDLYGDSTQDQCPTDPAIRADGCQADLALSVAADPDELRSGERTTLWLVASNASTGFVAGVVVTDSLPSGLQVVAADERCTGTKKLTCRLGTLGPGGGAAIRVSVRATAPGRHTHSAELKSAVPDPNVANNTASGVVTAHRASTPPVTLNFVKYCAVPKLRGLTLSKARTRLRRADCRLGRVKRSKARGRLVVVTQTPRPGSNRRAGTRVDVRLGRRR